MISHDREQGLGTDYYAALPAPYKKEGSALTLIAVQTAEGTTAELVHIGDCRLRMDSPADLIDADVLRRLILTTAGIEVTYGQSPPPANGAKTVGLYISESQKPALLEAQTSGVLNMNKSGFLEIAQVPTSRRSLPTMITPVVPHLDRALSTLVRP